jgi:AcrR family transcriptional regulator
VDGFERRRDKKAKQIFSASLELVSHYGFDKVSVNEIAGKARVSPATIYNYFGTKEQLYLAMLNHWVDSQLYEYDAVLQSENSYHDKIRAIMTLEAHNLRLLARMSHGQDPKPLQAFLIGVEEKLESFYRKMINLGKEEGHIAHQYSDRIMLQHFKLFFREISEHLSAPGNNGNDEDIDQLLQLFICGISPTKMVQ